VGVGVQLLLIEAGPLLQSGQLLLTANHAVFDRVVMGLEVIDFGQLGPTLFRKARFSAWAAFNWVRGTKQAARQHDRRQHRKQAGTRAPFMIRLLSNLPYLGTDPSTA